MRERAALPCAALVHGPLMRVRAVLPCARERRTQAADGRTRWSGWMLARALLSFARAALSSSHARCSHSRAWRSYASPKRSYGGGGRFRNCCQNKYISFLHDALAMRPTRNL